MAQARHTSSKLLLPPRKAHIEPARRLPTAAQCPTARTVTGPSTADTTEEAAQVLRTGKRVRRPNVRLASAEWQ